LRGWCGGSSSSHAFFVVYVWCRLVGDGEWRSITPRPLVWRSQFHISFQRLQLWGNRL